MANLLIKKGTKIWLQVLSKLKGKLCLMVKLLELEANTVLSML